MGTTMQVSMFDTPPSLDPVVPKPRLNDNGKRKTAGWVKKVIPTSMQAGLDLEALPLNDEELVEDYQVIHEKLLFVSLSPCLGDNVSLDHLEEVIEWVLMPIVNEKTQSVEPFSFQACCMASYVDAEKMRDMVFPELQKAQDKALIIEAS